MNFNIVPLLVIAKIAVHLICIDQYGIFRDELYFLACGRHPGLGYVDQPPLIGWLAAALSATVGESLFAIRILPVLAGAGTVWLAARLTRQLGGGAWAEAAAAVATLTAPVFLGMQHLFTMNAFDQLIWVASCYWLTVVLKNNSRGPWLAFGLLVGIGLLTKLSVVFFGTAVVLGILLGKRLDLFQKPWIWLAALLAAFGATPYILWQINHGWPTIEFYRAYSEGKTHPVSPSGFLVQQVMTVHPLSVVLWLPGLYWLLFGSQSRRYRPLGWVYIVCFALFTVQQAKFYMLSPLYPVLFAGGAVALETWSTGVWGTRLRWAYVSLLIAGGLLTAPTVLPLLPVDTFVDYRATLRGTDQVKYERHKLAELPQHFADMHGWKELTTQVHEVYQGLNPEEQAKAVIFTSNYGEAGAIDYFGPALGLPPATSGHNGYHAWGPRKEEAPVLIAVGIGLDTLRKAYSDVDLAARFECQWCMPYEDGRAITVSRKPKSTWADDWSSRRHYD